MRRRKGFTLVEMLVATALIMFIMAILSQAFVTSMDVFSQFKGIGDMEEGLRTATNLLRHDLSQDHFEAKRKLSDPNFWGGPTPSDPNYRSTPTPVFFPDAPAITSATSRLVYSAVREGFFHIRQGSPSALEGIDSEEVLLANRRRNSFIASNHILYFTVKMRGNRREDVFTAPLPAPIPPVTRHPLNLASTNFFDQPTEGLYQEDPLTFCSQWAEVAYFLVPTGTTVDLGNPNAGGTRLHALYRYQAAVVPRGAEINGYPAGAVPGAPVTSAMPNISSIPHPDTANYPGRWFFAGPGQLPHPLARSLDTGVVSDGQSFPQRWTPASWTAAWRQIPLVPAPPPLPPADAALLLTNVVSFNVRIQFVMTNPNQPSPADFVDVPAGQFDTSADPGYRILAVQITLRVWDQKSRQARQITIIQDI